MLTKGEKKAFFLVFFNFFPPFSGRDSIKMYNKKKKNPKPKKRSKESKERNREKERDNYSINRQFHVVGMFVSIATSSTYR